jgi:uncharacterized Ntn-hydrolase superfamily protein
MIFPSTFSIVAYDPSGPAWGIAVASKFPAVGAIVPWAKAGIGAIATQAFANTAYGPVGLNMMENNLSADATLRSLIASDPESATRQVGIVDTSGNAATFTGSSCHEWAGGLTGDGFAVQGNILTGPEVVQAIAEAFRNSTGYLHRRLYNSILKGDQAGGDRRGRQSAAILVVKSAGGYGGYNDRWIDYRVDDHPDPIIHLGELLNLHDLYFNKSPETDTIKLRGKNLIKIQSIMARLGYYFGLIQGEYDAPTRRALEAFIANENFEERTDFSSGKIDRPVFEFIIKHFS